MSGKHLPRSIDELRELMSEFATEESEQRGMAIDVLPTDIMISTYAKSGTTWLQQVAHQLRTGGDMDFEEISVVVPWLPVAHDMGIDPAVQSHHPRLFKLHRVWGEIPPGGRVITSFRSPLGVLRSFYRFFDGSFFESGAISVNEFTHRWFLEGSNSGLYFDHLVSFWPHIESGSVLALTYEDMTTAPNAVPRVVAEFMGIDDEGAIEASVRNSSRQTMADHVGLFDDHILTSTMRARTGYPVGDLAKVHASSPNLVIGPDIEAAVQAKWNEVVTPALGFANYEELRAAMPDPLGVRG